MPSNHLMLCRLLLLPSIFPSIRAFSDEPSLHVGGQSTGVSASVLTMNIQGWLPLRLTGLISLLSKGLSRVSSSTTIQKDQFFSAQPSLWPTSHIRTWQLERLWLYRPVNKVMSLLFNTLSRFVIAFLPRSKHLQISWLKSPYAVILEPKKRKSVTASTFSHLPWSDETRCHDLSFLNIEC